MARTLGNDIIVTGDLIVDGDVGIGSTAPLGKLEIELNEDNSALNPYTTTPILRLDNPNSAVGIFAPLHFHMGSGEYAIISGVRPADNDAALVIGFRTGDTANVWAERVRFYDDGKVVVHNIFRAMSASGLRLEDDGGNLGIAIADGGAVDIDSTLNVDGAATFNAATTVKPGTASDTAKVGGILSSIFSAVGNVGTGEDDLVSFSVPANTLAVNGQSIWFEAFGSIANNANAKTIKVHFGSSGTTEIINNPMPTSVANNWMIRGRIIRTGAATQIGQAVMTEGSAILTYLTSALNQTLSGAINFRITGEGVSNNDIVMNTCIIGWDGENS